MFLHVSAGLLRVIAFRICLVFALLGYCSAPAGRLPWSRSPGVVAAHLAHAAAVDTSKASAPLTAEAAARQVTPHPSPQLY